MILAALLPTTVPVPLSAVLAAALALSGGPAVTATLPLVAAPAPPPASLAAVTSPTAAPGGAAPEAPSSRTGGPWLAPVEALSVVRAFDAPAQRWLPGHRGVDLRAPAGTEITAPADGRVAFAGVVAGRPVVSIDHADPSSATGASIRTTYEPVTTTLKAGDALQRGDVVGEVADDSHCAGGCLHWGARRGEDYTDPLAFLRAPIRLLTPQRDSG